jgi:hypothetical protein
MHPISWHNSALLTVLYWERTWFYVMASFLFRAITRLLVMFQKLKVYLVSPSVLFQYKSKPPFGADYVVLLSLIWSMKLVVHVYLDGVWKFELHSQHCKEWPFVIPYSTLKCMWKFTDLCISKKISFWGLWVS